MGDFSTAASTTSNMTSGVPDFSVSSKVIDEANGEEETYFYNTNFPKYLGYYRAIPEFQKAVSALVMWVCGKGWTADNYTLAILDNIRGMGKDNFDTIMQNALIVKKFNGNSYAEIIRNEESGILLNLKPLNPQNVRQVYDKKGLLIRYDVWDGKKWEAIKTEKMFHLMNDRIASEMTGNSVLECCKWVIDARNEAMADKRRIMHRSSIRVLKVKSDDTTTYNTLKTQYTEAIAKGELLLIPEDAGQFEDIKAISTAEHSEWIQYLESFYYKAVGVPEIIMGGSQNYSEASSKVGHLTFEQPHEVERNYLEKEIWNQLQLKVDFDKPASLLDEMQTSEAANTGQTSFQPNELTAQVGRNE